MRKLISASLSLLTAFVVMVAATHAGPTPQVAVTGLAIATHDTATGELMGSGPSVASNGYMGTMSFSYTVTGGACTYGLVYRLDQYDYVSDTWVYCGDGVQYFTDSIGSGSHAVDFFVRSGYTLSAGAYQWSAWVCLLDSNGYVTSIKATDTGNFSFMCGSGTAPSPAVASDPTNPPTRTSGPSGPGSS